MRPGVDTNSTVGYKTVGMEDGQMTLAQDMSGVTKPSADLATFIKSNASGYSWSPANTVQMVAPNAGKAWTSNGNVPVNTGGSGIHYVSVMANGQSFNLPIADCPADGCTNGSPIAWASTNPGDQDTLASYKIAVDKEGGMTLATVAIGTGAVILAPTTLGGSLVAGGIVGGGTSAANQYIDDGKVDLVKTGIDTAKGATVGGLTFGVVKGAGALDGALDSVLPSSVKVVKDPVPVLVSGETKVVGSTSTAAANDASNGSNASTAGNLVDGAPSVVGKGVPAANDASFSVPKGYTIDNTTGIITGPGNGTGNQIFIGTNGNYYTLTGSGATRVVSPNPTSTIGATGQIGQDALASLGGTSQVSFQTSQGLRVVDQLAPGRIANEAKVGYTTLDTSTAIQIAKDAELLVTGKVNGVTWNFYTSPVTGQGGCVGSPSAPTTQSLIICEMKKSLFHRGFVYKTQHNAVDYAPRSS